MAYREGQGTVGGANDGYRSHREMLQFIKTRVSKQSGGSEAVSPEPPRLTGSGHTVLRRGHDPRGEDQNRRSLLASRDTSSSFVTHRTTKATVEKLRDQHAHRQRGRGSASDGSDHSQGDEWEGRHTHRSGEQQTMSMRNNCWIHSVTLMHKLVTRKT